jgi:Zn-dependent protease with chaperone function
MTPNPAGPAIVLAGLAIIVIGLLVWWGGFGWFGHLPGDIRIERETVRIYIPLVSMLVISIVLTLLLNLISRFF